MRENLSSKNSYCEFCCILSLLHRYIGSNVLVNLISLNFKCCTLHATSTGVMGHVNSFMMCPRLMSTWHLHCLAWVNYVLVLMADILNFSIMNSFKPFFFYYFYVLSKLYAMTMTSVGMNAPKSGSII
jgi:hypothetical protein